jgi:hypothetical protein
MIGFAYDLKQSEKFLEIKRDRNKKSTMRVNRIKLK